MARRGAETIFDNFPRFYESWLTAQQSFCQQAAVVQDLTLEVKPKEQRLTEAMTSIQEIIATPPIVDLLRRAGTGRLVDGQVHQMESAIQELKMGMLSVFDRADLLRGSTVMQLIHILNDDQTVRFLIAVADFQLRIRTWGLP